MNSPRAFGRCVLFLSSAILISGTFNRAAGQGCIAARSNQGILGELCGQGTLARDDKDHNPLWLRRLTVDMSVTDQYLFRGGFSHGVPKIKHLSMSLGGRMEGIPVRDAFGSSNGFRRPGYIISIDPGVMYSWRHETLSVNGPWALERNRRRSVSDIANGTHGDAAFADYTVIAEKILTDISA